MSATPRRNALRAATLALLVAVAGCATGPDGPPAYPTYAVPDSTSLEAAEAIESLQSYRFGDSRSALVIVEDLVRESLRSEALQKELAARLARLLGPGSTVDGRRFTCRQLALIGTEAEVPALAASLADPDLRDHARYALERIPGEAARAALANAGG